MAIYDLYGNPVGTGGGTSDFDVTGFTIFTEPDGGSARSATLLYKGKRLYPNNYPGQRLDFVRDYGGGVMIALGDSYTAMAASYFAAFAEKHGLVCDNRGLASSTIAGSEDGITVGWHPFWVRLDEAVAQYQAGHTVDGVPYTCEDVKLVVMMGGTNDWYTVDEAQGIDRIGTPDSTDKEQFYGALRYIFDTVPNAFPNADFVVILQPASGNAGNAVARLKQGIIREMTIGATICDCCFEWYNPANPIDLATYWQDDKLHMTAAGNEAIMAKLEKTVNNLPFGRGC